MKDHVMSEGEMDVDQPEPDCSSYKDQGRSLENWRGLTTGQIFDIDDSVKFSVKLLTTFATSHKTGAI